MACVYDQEQMLAHLYGLLSEEKSNLIQQDLSDPSCNTALERAQDKKAMFAAWEEVAPPRSLVQSTLARIRQTETTQTELPPETETEFTGGTA